MSCFVASRLRLSGASYGSPLTNEFFFFGFCFSSITWRLAKREMLRHPSQCLMILIIVFVSFSAAASQKWKCRSPSKPVPFVISFLQCIAIYFISIYSTSTAWSLMISSRDKNRKCFIESGWDLMVISWFNRSNSIKGLDNYWNY